MDSLQRKKRKKRLESQIIPLENGQTQNCSHQSEPQQANDCITFQNTLNQTNLGLEMTLKLKKKRKLSIAECHQSDKKMISNDKSIICNQNSQTTLASKTLDQGLISKGKDYVPSWNSQIKEWSPKLWLPTETDCVGLHSNWFNGSFKSMESNSWFSMNKWTPQKNQNLQRTCCPSLTCSIAELTEKESIIKETPKTSKQQPNSCRKVQLRTTPENMNILKQWFGCARVTYNWALSCIKSKPKEYKINMYWLRKRFINKNNIPKNKKYLLKTPKHVRDSAIEDLVKGFKLNFEKKKRDPSHTFNMKFRSKKESQSITIPNEAIKTWDVLNGEIKMYPTFLKNKINFHCRNIPNDINYDTKLILDKLGRIFLCIPRYVSACENQTGKHDWCSLDPGVRTFQTVYSPSFGTCFQIGANDISRIFRLCVHLDRITKKGKNVERAKTKLRNRIKNLVDEVHWKTIQFLLTNFNNIIIPPFNVSQMVKKTNRKIGKVSVRKMLCWKHYTFRKRLTDASSQHNVNIYVRGEEYTSKTCTHCGNLKHNLGAAKVYKCSSCHLKVDRDVNGSRNIFLKNASFVV